ncbi:D-glycero-alpha-D-manno-heptose-1,7-bisphosphate 7-phosphatase [Dapis sp. BLCC M126]|uniref:D-glycero-alpha-D-manno-heptose-1,7-bisphosphate 7-phosphatase n=1 Tax=Dapis sp. BLCC M126 TaxID=3400189 RepID=UPI003CEDA683
MKQPRFVVLDRDGTIIRERHYLSDPELVELLKRTADGLRLLREMGLGLVIVTNQSAIGRGYFDESRLEQIHQRLEELLASEGVYVENIYFCPHTPMDDCNCRKPRTGLLELAAKEHGFNPKDAFVIGDKPCDIELGQRMGATTFLVCTGYGSQVAAENQATPDYVVKNVLEAALVIRGLIDIKG